jgi:hypothetical protein
MAESSYRVIPWAKRRFDVEMANSNGTRKVIEGSASEREANAWIVQTQRMIRAASPWSPLTRHKEPGAKVSSASPLPRRGNASIQA